MNFIFFFKLSNQMNIQDIFQLNLLNGSTNKQTFKQKVFTFIMMLFLTYQQDFKKVIIKLFEMFQKRNNKISNFIETKKLEFECIKLDENDDLSKIFLTRIYDKKNNDESVIKMNEIIDSLFDYVSNLNNIPILELINNGSFVIVYKDKPIQITKDIYLQIHSYKKDELSSFEFIKLTVISKLLSSVDLKKFLYNIYDEYKLKFENELSDKLYYFEYQEKQTIKSYDPRGDISVKKDYMSLPKNLTFTYRPYYSNKTFKNLYGNESKEIYNQVDFFINNKNWYDLKGLPYHLTIMMVGVAGCGKCFLRDTPILMYDGTIKMVQDVVDGDIVMGDDSTPRNVYGITSGKDKMYKITNVKGESYVVNSEHILSLKYSTKKKLVDREDRNSYTVVWFNKNTLSLDTRTFSYKNKNKENIYEESLEYYNNIKEDLYVDINIQKYLSLSNNLQKCLKGYKVPVEFPHHEVDMDPYMLGYWLGDGSSSTSEITSQESSVLKYYKNNLAQYGCYLQFKDKYSYRINSTNNRNYFMTVLRKYNLLNNKHIPNIYKCNSREQRLKLLAGLIDADGSCYCGKTMFEFSQSLEHGQLIDDVIYLCQSLGFACYKNKKITSWTHKGVKKHGEAWRICISGKGLDKIPTLSPRKQALPRRQIKDVLVSGITVEELPEDEYFGFAVDGNHRFLLGNFTVTHNSTCIKAIANHTKRHIININFKDIKTVSQLKNLFYTSEIHINGNGHNSKTLKIPIEKRIYILEEIDAISNIIKQRHLPDLSQVRQNQQKKEEEKCEEELTLGEILTIFDGVLEIPGRIIVITSNYPENIDKAFMRPGRIDQLINFKNTTINDICEMYNSMFDVAFPNEFKTQLPNNILSFAEVQQIFIKYLKDFQNYSAIIIDLQNFKNNRESDIKFNSHVPVENNTMTPPIENTTMTPPIENTIISNENTMTTSIEALPKKSVFPEFYNIKLSSTNISSATNIKPLGFDGVYDPNNGGPQSKIPYIITPNNNSDFAEFKSSGQNLEPRRLLE